MPTYVYLFCNVTAATSVCVSRRQQARAYGPVLTVLDSQDHVSKVEAGLLLRQRTVRGHLHHRPGGNGRQSNANSQAQDVIAVHYVWQNFKNEKPNVETYPFFINSKAWGQKRAKQYDESKQCNWTQWDDNERHDWALTHVKSVLCRVVKHLQNVETFITSASNMFRLQFSVYPAILALRHQHTSRHQ